MKRFDFDNPEVFRKQRDEWGKKVYATLGPRLYLLAQIMATTYLIITETDKNDMGSRDTRAKMNVINEVYSHYEMFEPHFKSFAERPSYFLSLDEQMKKEKPDFKQYLLDYLQAMALLMIIGAEWVIATIKNNRSEMRLPYIHSSSIHPILRERYAREKMVDKYTEYRNRPKGVHYTEHSVEALIDDFLPNKEEEFKGFFKRIAKGWLEHKDFGGGKIPNFLIDYVNLGVLEAGRGLPLAYITEDDTFAKMVRGSDKECYAESKRYYKRFWRG